MLLLEINFILSYLILNHRLTGLLVAIRVPAADCEAHGVAAIVIAVSCSFVPNDIKDQTRHY